MRRWTVGVVLGVALAVTACGGGQRTHTASVRSRPSTPASQSKVSDGEVAYALRALDSDCRREIDQALKTWSRAFPNPAVRHRAYVQARRLALVSAVRSKGACAFGTPAIVRSKHGR